MGVCMMWVSDTDQPSAHVHVSHHLDTCSASYSSLVESSPLTAAFSVQHSSQETTQHTVHCPS